MPPVRRRALPLALLACLAGAPAMTQPSPPVPASAARPIDRYVAEAAQRFGVPAHWIWAVMRIESGGDSRAVSSAGAMGLMQIMPATWTDLRRRHRLGPDPFDPRDNILAGAAYLRQMHDRYGDVTAMLAAYNAGPGRYDDHVATGRPLPRETRAYLAMLTPAMGGGVLIARAAAPDPLAWRRAPLFAVLSSQAARVDGPDNAPRDRAQDGTASAPIPAAAGVSGPPPRNAARTSPTPAATAMDEADNASAAATVDDAANLGPTNGTTEPAPDRLFVPRSGREPS